jgi:hypothetical protein
MKKRHKHKDMILDYLKKHRGITQAQAIEKFGCYRLSGRIFDLRSEGYLIITTMKEVKNRFGDTCHVAEYRLVK